MGDLMWRVVLEDGGVQTVGVAFAPEVGSWAAVGSETDARGAVARAYHATPRQAVTAHAARSHWPVVEIRSPGEPTTAEQIAAERDADVAALKRELVATRVSALAQGNAATVLLASQSSLRAERDAERAEAEALRAIVEGRAEAPTDAEVAAHLAAGGDWLVRRVASELARETCEAPMCSRVVRWWPLDDAGRPTTWPEVQP
jgi:hypothetical protein